MGLCNAAVAFVEALGEPHVNDGLTRNGETTSFGIESVDEPFGHVDVYAYLALKTRLAF